MSNEFEALVAASASIPGWTAGEEARQIALASQALPENAVIVEVGVYMGRCTALLAGARKLRGSGHVHCVDPFDCSGDSFSLPHYREGLKASGFYTLESVFRHHLARLDLERWVSIHKGIARDIAAQWSGAVDLLLLDGDQSPVGAREAFDNWTPHLKRGGTIVLRNTRDREYAEGHDGHRRLALQEIVPPRYEAIRQIGGTTFAMKGSSS